MKKIHSNKKGNSFSQATKVKIVEGGQKIRAVQIEKQKKYIWAAVILFLSILALLIKIIS
ncbi:MAG TPA: hypothetical protein PLY70_08655 [Saprospiraceae bacterium]|nr:hypothetical protein [Saprospiraceae bacterium]